MTAQSCASEDLVKQRAAWLFWYLPAAVLLAGVLVPPTLRAALWTPALLVMGGACAVNAARCGRLHCYLTAPLFLGAALLTLFNGVGALAVPWVWIGAGLIVGTAFAHIPEWLYGQYARGRSAS